MFLGACVSIHTLSPVSEEPHPDRRAPERVSRAPWIVAGAVLAIALLLIIAIESAFLSSARRTATEIGSQSAARIDQHLTHALSSTYALAAVVRQGNGAIRDFGTQAREMLNVYKGVSALELAPGGIIREIVPLAGHEAALGYDLLQDPVRESDAARALGSRQLTLAGPFRLRQGGEAIIGRLPVFLPDASGEERFWGFTIALLRMPNFLRQAELGRLEDAGYRYALWREDPAGGTRQLIASSAERPRGAPVTSLLAVPNGRWFLDLAPRGGWYDPLRLTAEALAVLLLIGSLAWVLAEYQRGQRALLGSVERYRSLFDSLDEAVHVLSPDGQVLAVNAGAVRLYGRPRDWFVGRTLASLAVPGEAGPARVQASLAAAVSGTVERFDCWAKRPGGGTIPVEITLVPESYEGRKSIIAVARDISERKQHETVLRKQLDLQSRLANIAAAVPGMICSFRLDAKGTASMPYATPALLDLWALDPAQVSRDSSALLARIHADDIGRLRRSMRQSACSLRAWQAEFRVEHPVRGEIWLEARGVPQRDPDGGTLWHGFVHEITDRRRAGETLRLSEERLTRAQAIAHVGSWSVDCETRTLSVSSEASRLAGLVPGCHPAERLLDLLHPDDRRQAGAAWVAGLGRGGFDCELRFIVEDDVRCLHVRAEVTLDETGKPRNVVGVAQDVTDMRRVQTELKAHREHLEEIVAARTIELRRHAHYLRALIDNVPHMVWLKGRDGRYLAVNRAVADACGRAADAMLGKLDSELWSAELAARFSSGDREVMALRDQRTVEEPLFDQRGEVLMETYKAPVVDEDGSVLGIVGFSRDVSKERQVDQLRERALREARRLAEVRSEFLTNMSHEIRTPLSAVLGLAELGWRENCRSRAGEQFKRIVDSGQLLLGIINDILDFSKIESGRFTLDHTPFELGEAIDRAVRLNASQAYARGLEILVDEQPGLPRSLLGDSLRVSQVLVNLLSNAIKFTERGRIDLSVLRSGPHLLFRVSDTGIGISEEQMSRLFRPFEQADGSITRRYGGTGLGLAICRRLVEMMGGTLDARSRLGCGSTFEMRLPLITVAAAVEPPLDAKVRIAALAATEAESLAAALIRHGVPARIVPLDDALQSQADLVIVDASAEAAVGADPRVAFVSSPDCGDYGRDAGQSSGRRLDRPLRARHVLAMLQADATVDTAPEAPGFAAGRLRGIRVLAAEDNEVNRLVLSDMLEHEGAVLSLTENGVALVDQLRQGGPDAFDVVVTDIQMPLLDGFEATWLIHRIAPCLPVIGLTAHARPEERARCLQVGMVEHLAKPVRIDDLVEAITRHTRLARSREDPPGDAAVQREADAVEFEAPGSPIDWLALIAQYGGTPALVGRLIKVAARSCASVPGQLRVAAAQGDLEEIRGIAHTMKGTAGNLMAPDVYELAARTERAAHDRTDDAAELAEGLADATQGLLAALIDRERAVESERGQVVG
ncbi:MAG: PAS domain-containing protein [Methylotetracoccus sp.]